MTWTILNIIFKNESDVGFSLNDCGSRKVCAIKFNKPNATFLADRSFSSGFKECTRYFISIAGYRDGSVRIARTNQSSNNLSILFHRCVQHKQNMNDRITFIQFNYVIYHPNPHRLDSVNVCLDLIIGCLVLSTTQYWMLNVRVWIFRGYIWTKLWLFCIGKLLRINAWTLRQLNFNLTCHIRYSMLVLYHVALFQL